MKVGEDAGHVCGVRMCAVQCGPICPEMADTSSATRSSHQICKNSSFSRFKVTQQDLILPSMMDAKRLRYSMMLRDIFSVGRFVLP